MLLRGTSLTGVSVLAFVLAMASIHKNPLARSPFWFAAYRGPDGRRMKKSTGTTDRKLALSMAIEWEKASMSGKHGTLVEAKARTVLSEILEQATGRPLHFESVADYFEDWLKDKKSNASDKTALKYTQTSQNFLRALGPRSRVPLSAIAPADIRAWFEGLLKGGRAPSTVNTALVVISSIFEKAKGAGHILINPCNGITALRDDGKGERETFTPSQVAGLIEAAKGTDWEGAILVGCFTGLRLKDISELIWAAVDVSNPKRSFIRVIASKTGKGVAVPVHPDLQQWLQSQTQGIANAPIFPSLKGRPSGGNTGLSAQFKRLMGKAGISGKRLRTAVGAGRNTSSLSFHSLRHTFTSAMANAGVPEDIRMLLTGHATKSAHKIYTHHEADQVWNAIAALPGVAV